MSNEYAADVDAKLATPLPIASPSSVGFSPERLNRVDPAMQSEIEPEYRGRSSTERSSTQRASPESAPSGSAASKNEHRSKVQTQKG
jgi:hypothetical protein